MIDRLVRNWMSSPVITVTPKTTLTDARKITADHKIRALPVMDEERLVGIVTRRGLIRLDLSFLNEKAAEIEVALPDETVGDVMTRNPLTVDPEFTVPKAARIMLENKITALPVMDKGHLVGILTNTDVLRFLLEGYGELKKRILVSECMTYEVITIDPDSSLLQAHELMGTRRIRSLPVVEDGKLKGIVTRTDLMGADPSRLVQHRDKEASYAILTQPVTKLMTSPVVTISPEVEITRAAELMVEHKFHSLPVVNKEYKLVGILTESDLFQVIVQMFY
jgi:CBS domain-containing protein